MNQDLPSIAHSPPAGGASIVSPRHHAGLGKGASPRSSLTARPELLRASSTEKALSSPPAEEGGHLDRRELAKRWNTSVSTIRRMEKRNELPTLQLGPRVIRFRLEDIIAYEERNR